MANTCRPLRVPSSPPYLFVVIASLNAQLFLAGGCLPSHVQNQHDAWFMRYVHAICRAICLSLDFEEEYRPALALSMRVWQISNVM